MPGHDIIVVGASAGGVEALMTLVRDLPADIPATLFVVLHVSPYGRSALPGLLSRAGPLPATHAVDKQPFLPGHIYVAPPDYHMLVADGHIHVVQGPKENRTRPAIDPLFRTAAHFYGPRVVGVVLTGLLDDGTAGLFAIKHRGGIAVVQDPQEAPFPDMPESACTYVEIDHKVSVRTMGALLNELAHTDSGIKGNALMAQKSDIEAKVPDLNPEALEQAKQLGPSIPLSCPDCGGVLFSFYEGSLLRYRCQVGHAFSPQTMLAGHTDMVDRALWDGFNMLDEQVTLLQQLAQNAKQQRAYMDERRFTAQLDLLRARREQMRQLLLQDRSTVEEQSGVLLEDGAKS